MIANPCCAAQQRRVWMRVLVDFALVLCQNIGVVQLQAEMSSVKINFKGKDVDISVSASMTVAEVKEQVASEFDLGVQVANVMGR